MTRVFNFSAGPATLPESVLRQAADEMLDWRGSGMSVMEMSHRGKEFIAIHAETESLLRELRLDRFCERVLGHAARQAGLRQDSGHQARLGLGQVIGRRLAELHQRRVDLVQLGVGAHTGELGRPVAARHPAEGFVVMPEEAEVGHAGESNRRFG